MGTPKRIPIKIFITFRLLDSVSKLSTSLELSNLLSSDLNLLLGQRIDTLTSRTLAYTKCTKTNESNLVTLCQSVLNSYYCCVESFLSVNL